MAEKPKEKRKRRGERTDGRIQVALAIGRKPNGKPKMKSFYGRTRAEAEAKRDAYKRDIEDGIDTGKDEMTVRDWVDFWYEKYQKPRMKPEYAETYIIYVNRLKKAIGEKKIKAVRESDLQSELNSVSDMSESTIDKYAAVIKKVFYKAKKNKILRDNPAEDLDVPSGTKGTHRALERWETDCILQNWREHRAGLWAMLMLLCGLRRSEMIALRWENVDLVSRKLKVCEVAVVRKNQTVVAERAKSEAGIRTLPICAPLLSALKSVPEAKRSGFVCVSAKGERLTQSAYDRGWDGFCSAMRHVLNGETVKQQGKKDDIEKKIAEAKEQNKEYILFSVLAHDLRHTFATALFDADVPAKAAQYYLGHADIRITLELYTHLSKERDKREQSRMTEYLDAWLIGDSKPSDVPPEMLNSDLARSKLGQAVLIDE